MPKLKKGTHIPDDAEDATVTAAAVSDKDTAPLSDAQWASVQPILKRGRPFAQSTKERITIRLSQDVVRAFRESGTGWQTRLDAALKDWLKTHTPANMSELISGIAHEMGQPLQVLMINAKLIENAMQEQDPLVKNLGRQLSDSVQELEQILLKLRAFEVN